MTAFSLSRRAALLGAALFLAACGGRGELGAQRGELGDFRLGHTIVVADEATRGPASRPAEPEEWEEALTGAIERQFGRYDGGSFYHIAVALQGYVLAIPGIPLVAAPRSFAIIGVTVWDDAAGTKINETPHRIVVFESLSGETMLGSGLTQSAEQQMENLSRNAARMIERWMASNPDWFAPRPDASAEGDEGLAEEALEADTLAEG